MPQRQTIFTENAYYHIFNRGVEKRIIFLDKQDHQIFLDILTYYLKFTKKIPKIALTRTGLINTGLFNQEIKLIAYCLMPNHFHFLLHQKGKKSITNFMRRIGTTYAMYFNKRYKRVGSLFQGRFKAKHLDTEPYLLQTSKYIHSNPLGFHTTPTRTGLVSYPWSSYFRYIEPSQASRQIDRITHPTNILSYFSKYNPELSYSSFVEETSLANWYQHELKWLR